MSDQNGKSKRTYLKAGSNLAIDIDNIEKYGSLSTITLRNYTNGLTFNPKDSHLIAVPNNEQPAKVVDGVLKFANLSFSEAKLMEWSNHQRTEIVNVDLPLLNLLYSILLNQLNEKYRDLAAIDDISALDMSVKIYVPHFAKITNRSSNLNKKTIEAIVNEIASFNNIVGVLKNKIDDCDEETESVLPVLLFLGYEESTNTVEFTSPYMTRLIQTIYYESIKRDAKGAIQYQKNGNIELNPSHSKLVKTAIVNEKNKVAVEIVFEIIKVIERAGNHTPNIKAITLIERVPQLAIRLNKIDEGNVKNPRSNKNTVLKRAFTRAWELLDSHTFLRDVYKEIELPDPKNPKNIPKINSLQQVFEFPHKGKIKEK